MKETLKKEEKSQHGNHKMKDKHSKETYIKKKSEKRMKRNKINEYEKEVDETLFEERDKEVN